MADSLKSFEELVQRFRLPESNFLLLQSKGYKTMSDFVFSCADKDDFTRMLRWMATRAAFERTDADGST